MMTFYFIFCLFFLSSSYKKLTFFTELLLQTFFHNILSTKHYFFEYFSLLFYSTLLLNFYSVFIFFIKIYRQNHEHKLLSKNKFLPNNTKNIWTSYNTLRKIMKITTRWLNSCKKMLRIWNNYIQLYIKIGTNRV